MSAGASTIAVAKVSAEAASRPAAPNTGQIRSERRGGASKALASAMAVGSMTEARLDMGPRINGVGRAANIAKLGGDDATA